MLKNQTYRTISVVLPCKNEQAALKATLESIPQEVNELIVVDNGSTDKTFLVAKKFGAKVIREKRHENGIGYGFALSSGIQEASGDIIVCMDGDCSYPASEISKLIQTLEKKGVDFISCDRVYTNRQRSAVRSFGVLVLNYFFKLLYGYKIKDSLSGMWVFRKDIVEEFDLFEGGWNFSLEIKLNALMNPKIKFMEVSIPYHDRIFDLSKQNIFQTGFQHLSYLFKSRFQSPKAGISLLRPQPLFSTVST